MKNLKNLLILFISSLIIFTSCTQALPEIKQAYYTVIFDYEDSESEPDARLCVYATSGSNINRYDSLKVSSTEANFTWETKSLSKMSVNGRSYVGYTNFALPKGLNIPAGVYDATYTNADEEKSDVSFFVEYDSAYYGLKANEVEDKIKQQSARKKVAVYDAENVLIYYGDYTFSSDEDIKRKLKDADTFKIVWVATGNTLMCILPSVKVDKH